MADETKINKAVIPGAPGDKQNLTNTPGTMTALKNINKFEFMDMLIYEKKDPVWKSELFGIPIYLIGAGILAVKVLIKGKL